MKTKITKEVMTAMVNLSSEWNNTGFAVLNKDGSISATVWNKWKDEDPKRETIASVNGNDGWNLYDNKKYHWEVTPLSLMNEHSENKNKPKHTPGEWKTGVFQNNISQCPTVEVNGETICKVSSPTPSWDEAQANANLMSASPDMYEALKYARRFLNEKDVDIKFIDKALSKAEGK